MAEEAVLVEEITHHEDDVSIVFLWEYQQERLIAQPETRQ
jgi:hypothetical protein